MYTACRPKCSVLRGVAAPTRELWIALRVALRSVLEKVTIADLAAGTLPAGVAALLEDPDAWLRRPDPLATHRDG